MMGKINSAAKVKQTVEKADIINLFDRFSIELTVNAILKRKNLETLFAQNQLIYVTFLPGSNFNKTLTACEKLIDLGFQARPHIAARNLESSGELEQGLNKIQALGINSVLLIAGAVRTPKGPFASSMDILDKYRLEDYGIEVISFAGHPGGNPDIPIDEIQRSEKKKRDYIAQHNLQGSFTTQFSFQTPSVVHWLEHLKQTEVNMRVNLGVPGVVSTKSLINHARACGVGASLHYLLRYSRSVKQLMGINTPDAFIYDLALYKIRYKDDSLLKRLHFFPFGGVDATMHWINHIQRGEFDIYKKGLHIHAQ